MIAARPPHPPLHRISCALVWVAALAVCAPGCDKTSGDSERSSSGGAATTASGGDDSERARIDEKLSRGAMPIADYPARSGSEDALEGGRRVLAPRRSDLVEAHRTGRARFEYAPARVAPDSSAPGVSLRRGDGRLVVPASLVIALDRPEPLPEEGAVVLTWAPEGGGLRRARVVGARDGRPLAVDFGATAPRELPGWRRLAPGAGLQPGVSVAYRVPDDPLRVRHGIALHHTDEAVLVSGPFGVVERAPRSHARPLPLEPEAVEAGDIVWARHMGEMREATVLAVDVERERIEVRFTIDGDSVEAVIAYGDFTHGAPVPGAQ
jgi:hypothetical protein